MTVLNVEYFSELAMVPNILQCILFVLIISGSLCCVPMFLIKTKYSIFFGILLLIASFLIAVWMWNKSTKETDYISKKYAMFEDDKLPIEEFIDWEIVDFKGQIYILAPRDGKKIKDEEKNNG